MKRLKLTYILGLLLLILLAFLVVPLIVFSKNSGFDFKSYLLNFKEEYLSNKKSMASLYIEDQKIKIKFNIADKDRLDALEFSRRLGVGDSWFEGISLELDGDTRGKLSQILPLEVVLNFDNGKLFFKNAKSLYNVSFKNQILKSAQSKTDFEFATGSARISLREQNERDFSLDINNPDPLLQYATESGQLYLSKKLYGMFPILNNIARIELNVNGKNVNGEIQLK